MSWITNTLKSSIGKKVLMSLTGLFLCTFLVVHLIGNLQLFNNDGGYAFNNYTVFMTTFPLIKIVSYVNYALILFHAIWGIYLVFENKKARPVAYVVQNKNSTWSSRNMGILGTIILVFIAVHLSDFWYQYKFGHLPYIKYTENLVNNDVLAEQMQTGYSQATKALVTYNEAAQTKTTIVKDLYAEVDESFKNPLISIFYILAMVALGFHLYHGFSSAFKSLGINHKKYSPLIQSIGFLLFGILIPFGFATLPLYFLLK